jgi:hypothetical protein
VVLAEKVTMALLRAARGGRVVGRRGLTGAVGESLPGAMMRRMKVREDHRNDR